MSWNTHAINILARHVRILKALLKIIRFLPAVILMGTGLCLVYVGTIASEYGSAHGKMMVGNRQEMVDRLKAGGEELPFSFAVIGDTNGTETGEQLLSAAESEGDIRFVVNLGDVVSEPDIWQHRYFQTESREYMRGDMPMFLVAGNHDIREDPAKAHLPRERVVRNKEYDEMYGTRKFSFVYSRCLFIISDFDDSGEKYIDYIERVLREKRGECEHAFVFLHVPPVQLRGTADTRVTPRKDELFRILKEYSVDTAFFGDFHGYWRGKVNDVSVAVTGGGGSRLQGDTAYGFHHLLVITVDKNGTSERIISIPTAHDLDDKVEKLCFTMVFPALGASPAMYYAVGAAVLLAGAAIAFKMIRARLRRKAAWRPPLAARTEP